MSNNPGWISVKDNPPDILQPVWISNGKGWTMPGCRTKPYKGKDGKLRGFWSVFCVMPYEYNGVITGVVEEYDMDVQLWHPIPKPPKI